MVRASLLALIIATSAMATEPAKYKVKHQTDAAWAWATAVTANKSQQEAQAQWAWAVAASEPVRPCYCGSDCKCKDCDGKDCKCNQAECYRTLIQRSLAENKPILIGVDYEPPTVDGFLRCRWDAFPKKTGPMIVVGQPKGSEVIIAAKLSKDATAAQVKAAIAPTATPVTPGIR